MVTESAPVPLGAGGEEPSELVDDRSELLSAASGSPVVGGALDLEPFRLIGFTWSGEIWGEYRVRHTDGSWGPWSAMAADSHADSAMAAGSHDHADSHDHGVAEGSAPAWVGWGDGYEVRILGGSAAALDVHLVREGSGEVALQDGTRSAGADSMRPAILGRSAWGARPPKEQPRVAQKLRLGVVHHTGIVSHNEYLSTDMPAILRAMQAFHMDVRGWDDIGYNFVVDRDGRKWEARAGGTDRAVIGSHARGFNTGSTSVALIGEHSLVPPSDVAIASVGELLGWKLFVHGVDPAGESVYTSLGAPLIAEGERVRLPRIVGHRDVGSTGCPGDHTVSRMEEIRAIAARAYADRVRTPNFAPSSVSGWVTASPLVGDFDGDGREDVFWYGPGAAADRVWYGEPNATFAVAEAVVRGVYEPFTGDFDGDGNTDIFWYTAEKTAASLSFGRSGRSPKFDTIDLSIVPPGVPIVGDFDADGDSDIFWHRAGELADELWQGTSDREFEIEARQVFGDDYQPFGGDFDGDGVSDIYWYAPGPGIDIIWYGSPGAVFDTRSEGIYGTYQPLVGDLTGDGVDDTVLAAEGNARVSIFTGSASRDLGVLAYGLDGDLRPLLADVGGGGVDELLWHGEGRVDLWQWGAGGVVTRREYPAAVGAPVVLDVDGDGRDDLLWARPGSTVHQLWTS